jgi:hypothetical protein
MKDLCTISMQVRRWCAVAVHYSSKKEGRCWHELGGEGQAASKVAVSEADVLGVVIRSCRHFRSGVLHCRGKDAIRRNPCFLDVVGKRIAKALALILALANPVLIYFLIKV